MNETEQQIVKYLKNHPHFFARHLELLDTLQIPHRQKGTLSLVEMQLERQRKRIKELERELAIFGRLAHREQDIFLGLMPLQQQLSHTEHFLDGVQKINDWAQQYDLQQAKILLFRDSWMKTDDVPEQHWVDRKAFEIIRLERMGLKKFTWANYPAKKKSAVSAERIAGRLSRLLPARDQRQPSSRQRLVAIYFARCRTILSGTGYRFFKTPD